VNRPVKIVDVLLENEEMDINDFMRDHAVVADPLGIVGKWIKRKGYAVTFYVIGYSPLHNSYVVYFDYGFDEVIMRGEAKKFTVEQINQYYELADPQMFKWYHDYNLHSNDKRRIKAIVQRFHRVDRNFKGV
jgi:hypothetical protein